MTFTTLDTAVPAGSDLPSIIDDSINDTKTSLQERLDVDHEFNITGTIVDANETTAGKHTQVTFAAAIATPTPITNQAILYIKVVDSKDELHYKSETSGNEIQITDDDELYPKPPAEGADADSTEKALAIEGNYVGDGNANRVIELGTGIVISSMTIMKVDDNNGAPLAFLVNGSTPTTRKVATGTNVTSEIYIDTAHSFKIVPTGDSSFNKLNTAYFYSALCRRA